MTQPTGACPTWETPLVLQLKSMSHAELGIGSRGTIRYGWNNTEIIVPVRGNDLIQSCVVCYGS